MYYKLFSMGGYTGKTVHMKCELREHIIISEISIDMNRECARSINVILIELYVINYEPV